MPIFSVLAVLKRNCIKLLHCLPQNSRKTVEKFKKLHDVTAQSDRKTSELLDQIFNSGSDDQKNQMMLASIMHTMLHGNVTALLYCDILEKLLDNKNSDSESVIKAVRNGM